MAYMNQEKKKVIAAKLKEVMPKGWKYSVSVRHHSAIVLTIRSAPVDLLEILGATEYTDINEYHYHSHYSQHPEIVAVFDKLFEALNTGNHNNSDPMTDYFDVGHYVDLKVGAYGKPFVVK